MAAEPLRTLESSGPRGEVSLADEQALKPLEKLGGGRLAYLFCCALFAWKLNGRERQRAGRKLKMLFLYSRRIEEGEEVGGKHVSRLTL